MGVPQVEIEQVLKKSKVSHVHKVYSTLPPVALQMAALSSFGSGSMGCSGVGPPALGTKNQRAFGLVLAKPFCQICQKVLLLGWEGGECDE